MFTDREKLIVAGCVSFGGTLAAAGYLLDIAALKMAASPGLYLIYQMTGVASYF